MHHALAVTASVLFFASSTSALYFPQFLLPSATKLNQHGLTGKCTFTVWHKQICPAAKKTNYIQINEIEDHANHITIDLADKRPASARNSYNMISPTRIFAIEGLLDDRRLMLTGSQNDEDEVLFEYGDMFFSSQGYKTDKQAFCATSAWDTEDWECGMGSRVS